MNIIYVYIYMYICVIYISYIYTYIYIYKGSHPNILEMRHIYNTHIYIHI